ncbi:MAG: hypothetical protein HY741_08580 [Chloroflexi bacterium]|nr:hypothetical protein [Chloroflexota bacterium]
MPIPSRSPRYRSYLLRFWQEPSEKPQRAGSWRFMLEDPHTGERHGFATFDNLIGHLHNLMNSTDVLIDPQFNSQTDQTPPQNDVSESQSSSLVTLKE